MQTSPRVREILEPRLDSYLFYENKGAQLTLSKRKLRELLEAGETEFLEFLEKHVSHYRRDTRRLRPASLKDFIQNPKYGPGDEACFLITMQGLSEANILTKTTIGGVAYYQLLGEIVDPLKHYKLYVATGLGKTVLHHLGLDELAEKLDRVSNGVFSIVLYFGKTAVTIGFKDGKPSPQVSVVEERRAKWKGREVILYIKAKTARRAREILDAVSRVKKLAESVEPGDLFEELVKKVNGTTRLGEDYLIYTFTIEPSRDTLEPQVFLDILITLKHGIQLREKIHAKLYQGGVEIVKTEARLSIPTKQENLTAPRDLIQAIGKEICSILGAEKCYATHEADRLAITVETRSPQPVKQLFEPRRLVDEAVARLRPGRTGDPALLFRNSRNSLARILIAAAIGILGDMEAQQYEEHWNRLKTLIKMLYPGGSIYATALNSPQLVLTKLLLQGHIQVTRSGRILTRAGALEDLVPDEKLVTALKHYITTINELVRARARAPSISV